MLAAHPESLEDAFLAGEDAAAVAGRLAAQAERAVHDSELAGRLRDIDCPTLVVFGTKDRLVALEAGRTYAAEIPNVNVSLMYDAGHLLAADRPGALTRLLADYIARRDTFVVGRSAAAVGP